MTTRDELLDWEPEADAVTTCDECGQKCAWYGMAAPANCPECGAAYDDLADFGPLAPLVAGMRDALDAAALALACAECLAETCTTPCAWCAAVRKETV